jgi:hypothetical protein
MKKSFSTPWTHEFFADSTLYFVLASFLLIYVRSFPFCFLHSDNENPKKDAATAPSAEAMAADEPSFQEAAPVVKSPKAPVKRVASTCRGNLEIVAMGLSGG